MNVVPQKFEIIQVPVSSELITEEIARTCYQSSHRIGPGTAVPFVRMLRTQKPPHLGMFDHVSATVRWTVNVGIGRELTRHRIAAYAQESTRYCSYDKERFGGELTFIAPAGRDSIAFARWGAAMADAERAYLADLAAGMPAELARDLLPMALKAELVSTYNFTGWRNLFEKRGEKSRSHPQMRTIVGAVLQEFQARWPAFFEDL